VNPRLWLAFFLLEAALSATPGPAVFTIVGQGIAGGWRRAFWGGLGIEAANLAYFVLSALGVGAFLAGAPRVVLALKLAGIGYLGWTAVRLLLARGGAAREVRAAAGGRGAAFKQALATQLGNPKAVVFFASLLAPFIDLEAPWPVPAQLAVYAATTVATELPILVVYGWVAGRGGALFPEGRVGPWPDRVAGACLLAVAGWLLLRG